MDAKTLHVVIASPEKTLFDGKAESVSVPGTKGSFTVLPQHAPLISSLRRGCMEYAVEGKRNTLEITGGFIEVRHNEVSICIE